MRRIVASFGAVALATALLVPSVAAAPAQRVSDTESVLFCDGLASGAGFAFVFAVESEAFGSFGDLAFWEAPSAPETSDPTWITAASSADFDGTSVSASFDLVEFELSPNPEEPPFGDPVGTAALTATLTPVGDPQPYKVRDHFGNQNFRREGVAQEYSVAGSLELPMDITFDLSSCGAFRDTYTQFSNAPASSVSRSSQFTVDCFWEVDDTFIGLFAIADEFGAFSDIFISSPDTELGR